MTNHILHHLSYDRSASEPSISSQLMELHPHTQGAADWIPR